MRSSSRLNSVRVRLIARSPRRTSRVAGSRVRPPKASAAAPAPPTGGGSKGEHPKGEPRLAGVVVRTPQQGAQPGKQLLEGERFWQVVVGAHIQTRHPVRDAAASCET